jgi:CO dehydrogenase/acetyl-CoA synthase alpha subunit
MGACEDETARLIFVANKTGASAIAAFAKHLIGYALKSVCLYQVDLDDYASQVTVLMTVFVNDPSKL